MKEEIDIRDTDYRGTLFGQKKVGMMVSSGICWFVEKGVLEINNLKKFRIRSHDCSGTF